MDTHTDTGNATIGEASNATIGGKVKSAKKGKVKPGPEGNGKRSLNLSLPIEDYQRLAIHAMRADSTISDLVSQLARTHLREYHIVRTATRGE